MVELKIKSRIAGSKKRRLQLASLGAGIIIAAYGIYNLSQPNLQQTTPDNIAPVSAPNSTTPTPNSTTPLPDTPPVTNTHYPIHENITATVFWVGEGADNTNDFIHNRSSAWVTDWVAAYGGVDDPTARCDYRPCAFTPMENPFYFALPFNDYTDTGLKPAAVLENIPWYTSTVTPGTSIVKNHWIEVRHGSNVAFAQWQDVGPFGEDDIQYVFGTAQPAEPRAGLDMSPALADYLGIDGRGVVSWRFVDEANVPQGEWTKIITRSGLQY